MELVIVAATATTRFLPFLDPSEESALLAAAPVQSFATDQLVFDQNVPLRAIFLIDDGSVRIETASILVTIYAPGDSYVERRDNALFVAESLVPANAAADPITSASGLGATLPASSICAPQ